MGNERTKEYPDILDFVNKSLESRDQYDNEEWLREQLSEVDQKRREHLEPLLTEAQTLITKGDDGLVSLSPSTESKKYNADWKPSFDGWSAKSKPVHKQQEGGFFRRFKWQYRRRREVWELDIPGPLFKYYTERHRTREFGTYISDPFDRQYLSSLADRIRSFGDGQLSLRERINAAVRFVQSLQYTPDDVTTGQIEYPKYPIETLVHEGGDCEDTSILLGALLRELGCDVALLVLPNHNHMILGASPPVDVDGSYYEYNGVTYYTIEATGHGWDIGQMPRQYRNASAEIYPVGKDPVLVHEWSAKPEQDGSVILTAHVANFGDAVAKNVSVFVEFEDDSGSIITRKSLCAEEDIPPSVSDNFEISLCLPDNPQIRGKCLLIVDQRLHDSSISDWQ
jgi:predicted transglutaminase-like cysteine proteinase